MIVVDASVLVNALADDSDAGDTARLRLARDPSLHAPHVIDLEVLSVLRRAHRAGGLDERRATMARRDLRALPVQRYGHEGFADRVWELKDTVTPYDAVYIALAEVLGCVLVTADGRLSRASGPRCEIEVVTD